MGAGWRVWAWVVVMVGVLVAPSHPLNWGKSLCNLLEEDKHWLQELSAEAEMRANASVAALQRQMDQVLAFVESIRKSEDTWLALSTGAATVERDLSNHQEEELPVPSEHNASEDTEATSVEEVEEQEEEQEEEERKEITRDVVRRKNDEDEDEGPKKGECAVQVMDNHATIGLFYIMSYNHGHCSNRHPITEPVRYCLGYCTTKTFIDRGVGIWSQGNKCLSCQPRVFETIRIPLLCDDGFRFEKSFENVVDCMCQGCTVVQKKE